MKTLYYFVVLLLMAIFYSCSKTEEMNVDELLTESNVSQENMDKQIIASLGLDTQTMRDMGSYYIVEEDIAFDKDSLFCYQPKARQARHTTLIQVPYENFISLSTCNMPTSGLDNWLDA